MQAIGGYGKTALGAGALHGWHVRHLNPVERVMRIARLPYLAKNCTHMLYPNYPGRSPSNRHYLYIGGQWVDPTTLDTSMGAMVGTLNADGTGGSLSYTPEIVAPTLVEGISILYTNSNVVVPILSIGFNRALTAGERTALSGLITPIATAAGVSAAACSLVTGQEFQQRCLKMKVNTALAGSANDTFVLPAAGAGTYAYTVDWGNGSREYVTANNSQTKDYDATSTFVVKVYGTYRPYFNNGGDKSKLIGLQIGATNHTTLVYAFYGCAALATMVGYANTAEVTSMAYMFNGCSVFNQSVANFNTAKVTSMDRMFVNCYAFNQSVANFNTALVTNMNLVFNGCSAFNQSLANFNTAKVTSMDRMFNGCSAFNQSVANFNTALVTHMGNMFNNCTAFKQSLAAFNMAAVSTITDMCAGCNLNATGTTTNYDATLVAWAAQDLVNSLTMTATNCKYGDAGEVARTAIATDDSWTFVDGGHI
jgi:surface protein